MKNEKAVTAHLEDLWRYARVLTKDDEQAEDLVQESLAKALRVAHSYDEARPLLPWLITILRTTFLTGVAKLDNERSRLRPYSILSRTSEEPAQEHSAEK